MLTLTRPTAVDLTAAERRHLVQRAAALTGTAAEHRDRRQAAAHHQARVAAEHAAAQRRLRTGRLDLHG